MESGGPQSYPDSVDSSPRSRAGDSTSWDDPHPSTSKLRLMCSCGGQIVPRPHDRSLCYLGGDTRIVVVDRQSSLSDLVSKLSRSLFNSPPAVFSFSLKYQLPTEDLDSLISLASDEDLDNMIDEYDRITSSSSSSSSSNRSSRIRIFVFPAKSDSASESSIGSLLDDSKSETWFVDALNSAVGPLSSGPSADSIASVNCLLGLEEDKAAASASAHNNHNNNNNPNPNSVPRSDGARKETDNASSYGSASSALSQSNIRVPEQRAVSGGVEEQLAQMNLSAQKPEEGAFQPPPAALHGNPNQDDHGGMRKPPQPPIQQQQQQINPERPAVGLNPVSDLKQEPQYVVSDPGYRVQISDQGYAMPIHPDQVQQQQQHQQQQQQQQYIHANPHLIHQHNSNPVVPMQSYYQVHHPIHTQQQFTQPHTYNQQIPMYYFPVRPPSPTYTIPMQQPNLGEAPQISASSKPTIPLANPVLKGELAAAAAAGNIYRTSAGTGSVVAQPSLPPQRVQLPDQNQQYMSYQQLPPHPSQAPATAGYGYEFTDPVHSQQAIYYSQAPSALLPSQYQTMSSSATVIPDSHGQLQQQPDLKQK